MKYKKTKLKSGLLVVTVPMPDNPSVTILVMAETGSKYENKKTNGISHFLEHLVFKGTNKRPKSSEISRELDSLGASYNAFTTQEFTGYYAKAAKRHFAHALDIIADMYVDPIFDPKELEKEKGVIIEEIRMYNDMPQRHVHDVISEVLFGDQPAGWEVIGTEANIRSFGRDDIISYRTKHYVAGSTTVIVSGSFDEKKVLSAIEAAFGKMRTGAKDGKLGVKEKQKSPSLKTVHKDTDQTHLVIALRTFSVLDKRNPTLQVLSSILGGSMSSRLFIKMRDEMGICYYVRSSQNQYTDHGDLSISAGVDNSRVKEAITGILAECKRLADESVPAAELQKAKDNISGTTMLELETSDSRAEFFAVQEVLKHSIETPDDMIKKIQKVTAKDVQKLAREIFTDDKLNLALIGKAKEADIKPYFHF